MMRYNLVASDDADCRSAYRHPALEAHINGEWIRYEDHKNEVNKLKILLLEVKSRLMRS